MTIFTEIHQVGRRVFSWRQIGVFLILVVGLTLATMMFAVGYGYSSHSLPYKDAQKLAVIGRVNSSNKFPYLLPSNKPFFEWKERKDLFTDLAIFKTHSLGWRIRGTNGNASISGKDASSNFFDVLGVSFPGLKEWKQSVGRRDLDTLVFTHGLGMKEFGYSAMGHIYPTLDGKGIVAAGILPADFALPIEDTTGRTGESALMPVSETAIGNGIVIGRLAPGITPQIAEQALASMPDEDIAFWGKVVVKPLLEIMAESSRSIVWGSWILSGLVLILCSANLSGILLVRCSYQLREYATRTALGAGFLDLTRLLLMELAGMSVIASLAAWVVGRVAIILVGNVVPVKYLSFGRPTFGWAAAVFLAAATIIVAGLSVAAALAVIGRNYRCGFSRRPWAVFYSHRWLRISLTVGQTAIAMLLLSVSYMSLRGYLDMFNRDVGLDTDTRVVSVYHSLRLSKPALEAVTQNTLDTLRGGDAAVPAAVYAGMLFDSIIDSRILNPESPVGRLFKPGEALQIANVSPGFFKTVKARILAGREFNDQDPPGAVMVNAAMARRMGLSPVDVLGQRLGIGGDVIGVVSDFPIESWASEVSPQIFQPLASRLAVHGAFPINYVVHPEAFSRVGSIERVIVQADPEAVIARNVAWRDLIGESVRGQTFATISVILFTVAAIVIVAVGIANTVMFIIVRRTREIAIHMAVGASARQVCWFVTSDMVKSGIAGILIGGFSSWLVGKAVAHFIYHGDRYQNLTGLVLTSAAMILIIVITSLLPALRALRIEPSRALTLE